MDILLIGKRGGRLVRVRAGWGTALTLAAVLVVLLGGNAYLGWRWSSGTLLDSQTIAVWEGALDAQRDHVAATRAEADEAVGAMARRLARLQARLLRIEALGERVAETANLDNGEFDFRAEPALGGPEDAQLPDPGYDTPMFLQTMDDVAASLSSRESQLEVLETLLANRQFHDERAIRGRPIVKGWMSSPFGNRIDPISGRPAWHAGVDFAGKEGDPVHAVAGGVVTWAGERYNYGHMVEIHHGEGYTTRYGHHDEVIVTVGQVVKQGEVIGRMGSTGRSTGPHVHFEVLQNGRKINPARFIARAR